jgi:hypothetical protein
MMTSTTVTLHEFVVALMPYVVAAVGAIISICVALITKYVHDKFGIDIEAKHRDALHSALLTGTTAALSHLGDRVGAIPIDVRKEVVRDAVLYAEQSVPDALKHFNITPEILAEMIQSKIVLLEQKATPAATP